MIKQQLSILNKFVYGACFYISREAGGELKEQGFLELLKIVVLVFLDRPAHDGLNATVKEK